MIEAGRPRLYRGDRSRPAPPTHRIFGPPGGLPAAGAREETPMSTRLLGAGLLLSAALLATGCACHKGCKSVASAPPCCPPPAPPPCCPPGGGTIAPPPVSSGFAPPVVSIPGH